MNKWIILFGIISVLLTAFATIYPIYLFKSMIQIFESTSTINNQLESLNQSKNIIPLIHLYQNDFFNLILTGIITVLILVLFSFSQSYLFGLVGKRFLFQLRNKLYETTLYLP